MNCHPLSEPRPCPTWRRRRPRRQGTAVTATTPTPADVARLVEAAREVNCMLDVRIDGDRWMCEWCLQTSRPDKPHTDIPHHDGCIVAEYRAALAPWADAKEDRDD